MSKRAEEAALKAYPPKKILPFMAQNYRDKNKAKRVVYRQGYEQAEKELTPLINRLCEAILFDWKDKAELARKIQIQIKEREEEK